MRLTNRGRVACGVTVTVVALAGQSAYSALRGHSADAANRQASAATAQAPMLPTTATPTPVVSPNRAGATTTETTSPVTVMDSGRDDLPPTTESTPTASDHPIPTPTGAGGLPPGNGQLATVAGSSGVRGKGPLQRYRVQLEGGIGEDGAAFADAVQRTLTDKRSWGAQWTFRRVSSGSVDFTVVLATPTLAERLCKPLEIQYKLSCFSGGRSVVNLARWRLGVDAYAGNLAAYRQYVVNHEVGHALGHDHQQCPGAGQLAPVMMQQTKGIGVCRPNPWPYPGA